MKKRIMAVVLAAVITLSLGACSGGGQAQGAGSNQAEDAGSNQAENARSNQAGGTGSSRTGDTDSRRSGRENMTFDRMEGEVKGTTATFCGWGRDEKLNRWPNDELARVMKEKYDITMERVPMDISQVSSQLAGETQAGEKDRGIDMIRINGENFQLAKENNMLYGPFTDKLPSFSDYVDGEGEDVTMGFAYPIEGYEAPCGKAQLVMVADLAVIPSVPKNAGELKEFAEKYPGKVAYSALPDSTGSVLVRNIIYEICGYEQFMDTAAGKETVRVTVAPAMEYLRELNPYPWSQSAAFPDSFTTTDNMLADGGLVMSMTYGVYDATLNIEDGKYTDTMAAFQFKKGIVGSTNFMAIAASLGNKAEAMVAVNEMISLEVQAGRYEKLRVIPALDDEKLSGEQKTAFDKVDLGKDTIPQDELLFRRLPEMSAQLAPITEEIQTEEVMNK